jgi:predicted site-specific integrase-resolvase
MNYKLSKSGKIKYLDFPSGVYRIHDKGVFSLLKDEEKQKITNIFIDKISIDYKNWKNG